MAIDWKKVSEHPLPEGDGVKQFLVRWSDGIYGAVKYPRTMVSVTDWAEINLPEEDKEPEITLWSVWQDELNHMHVLSEIGALGYLFWDVKKHRTFVLLKDEILKQFKPRPDLEVLAPSICLAGHGLYMPGSINGVLFYNKEEGSNHYQWPASLSQMIIVPKGGV